MVVQMLCRLRMPVIALSECSRMAMLGYLLAIAMPAMGQAIYQPPVPAPKNPAAFA